jgi:hypothetical protein
MPERKGDIIVHAWNVCRENRQWKGLGLAGVGMLGVVVILAAAITPEEPCVEACGHVHRLPGCHFPCAYHDFRDHGSKRPEGTIAILYRWTLGEGQGRGRGNVSIYIHTREPDQ